MVKNKRLISAAIVCIVLSTFLLTVSAAALDKGSTRKLNSRADSSDILPWDECVIVTITVPDLEKPLVCGIMPGSKYTHITDYSDREQVEKTICIYVSSTLKRLKVERPSEFTYTISFPKGMETPAWANEPTLTVKDPMWLEGEPKK